jgi:hypothetical protein
MRWISPSRTRYSEASNSATLMDEEPPLRVRMRIQSTVRVDLTTQTATGMKQTVSPAVAR